MQLSTATAGNQAVMSDANEFMRMAERGHARRVSVERLHTDVHQRVDHLTSRFSDVALSPAEIKGELLALAILVDDHANKRHQSFCESLADRIEEVTNGTA